MSDSPVYLERHGDVAELVLNRPDKHNAMNRAIWQALPDLVREVEADKAVKVLVLRGATPRAFSAGADIAEFREVHATPESARAYHGEIAEAFDAVAGLSKPTIALIQGICFGGGCALTLCCDFRYADETTRFCIPPAKLGLAYSLLETKKLTDLVGPSVAKEMLFAARVLDSDDAFRTGLVTRLFPADKVREETFAFAEELCALSQYTIRATKHMISEIVKGVSEETERTRRLAADSFEGPDYREGRDAFLEKRPPKFTYR